MKRKSKDKYYLDIARMVSTRSTCLKRQYGCVIVKNDEIISTGYNGSPRGEVNCCDNGFCKRLNKPHNSGDYSDCCSVHSEQNAMISASRNEMIDSTMYLVCMEDDLEINAYMCPICLRMAKNAGIKRFVNRGGELYCL